MERAQEYGVLVSRIGPKWSSSNKKGVIEPIHDTIETIVAATSIEKTTFPA